MKNKSLFVFILFISSFYKIYAGNPSSVKPVRTDVHPGGQFISPKDWSFVENRGQLVDENGNIISDVKYYSYEGGAHLYCRPGKISFVFEKIENKNGGNISEATGTLSHAGGGRGWISERERETERQRVTKTTNRIDLTLLNSNPNAEILASDQQEYYENYYTVGTGENGITNVHTYKTITYKNIYPHIDMVLHAKPSGMKYEFVVNPDGKVSDIQLQWNGLDGIEKLKDSKMEYSFALGRMEESSPVSFQGTDLIKSDFTKTGNRIGFDVGRYDKRKQLVIDPYLEWATYFGGSEDELGFGVASDSSGNVYLTGWTISNTGIASSGAYQTEYRGGDDAFLAKFNSAGNRLWATYFGAGGDQLLQGICTDPLGNVYITGRMVSGNGVATSGAYQTSNAGNYDAYIAKFNGSGNLSWATFYGGTGDDFGHGICSDRSGNIYVVGETNSTNGIATSGTHQTSFGGGSGTSAHGVYGDAFLAKFSNSGSLLWATYYGGNGYDVGESVSADLKGNVYITGHTESINAMASSNAYQTSYAGNVDAFLAKFSSSGTELWATYYGGSDEDQGYGVCTDTAGNV